MLKFKNLFFNFKNNKSKNHIIKKNLFLIRHQSKGHIKDLNSGFFVNPVINSSI